MKRHEFAPSIVPPDIKRFLLLNPDQQDPATNKECEENRQFMPAFYNFYKNYCVNSSDNPISREIENTEYNFSHVVAVKMTRTKKERHALVLRSTSDGFSDDSKYRLFVHPFTEKEDVVTEYAVTKHAYSTGDHPRAIHSMLFLATANDETHGLLEISGEPHQPSVWADGNDEYMLESIPYIPKPNDEILKPEAKQKVTRLKLTTNVIPLALTELPEAM